MWPLRPTQTPEHTLLYASIADVQSAISANDSKASAALVAHGLIFTGTLTLIVHLGGIYHQAPLGEKLFGLAALGTMLVAFLLSIFFLLRALLPYHPARLEDKMRGRYEGVFFPLALLLELEDPHRAMMERIANLSDPQQRTAELVAERLKLADIRNYEVSCTQRGYVFLLLEVLAAGFFLVAVALPAL